MLVAHAGARNVVLLVMMALLAMLLLIGWWLLLLLLIFIAQTLLDISLVVPTIHHDILPLLVTIIIRRVMVVGRHLRDWRSGRRRRIVPVTSAAIDWRSGSDVMSLGVLVSV